jgi:hypothetical protein
MDTLGELPQHCGKETLQLQWTEWIEQHSRERLLTACYILDSWQALLFGRRTHIANASAGLDLCVSVQHSLWDASDPAHWAQSVRAHNVATTTVNQLLENIGSNINVACDSFQSALVLACYAASTTAQVSGPTGTYATATHPVFDHAHHHELSKTLASHQPIQIMCLAIRLISLSPLRALVATAGESWFFSRKLANNALEAAEEFHQLKRQLREWTDDCGGACVASAAPGASAAAAAPPSPFLTAVGLSLDIVLQAVTAPEPHITLSFGPEMALYIASLALWAATFAGLTRPRASNPAFLADAGIAEWEPLRAENLVKSFLPQASEDVKNALATGAAAAAVTASSSPVGVPLDGPVFPSIEGGATTTVEAAAAAAQFPPLAVLNSWVVGVGNVIRWTAWVLGGSGHCGNGSGELINGSIGVLETLNRNGFVQLNRLLSTEESPGDAPLEPLEKSGSRKRGRGDQPPLE